MAHLDSSYTSYETFLRGADNIWSVDLDPLNKSDVDATALLAMSTEDDGTRYLNVSIFADSMTPDQAHAQHVHGTFDATGMPTNAVTPTIADDADGDGFVEVLEGVADYGDVLLPLNADGSVPVADMRGNLSYLQAFDIDDPANTLSPVTGTQYDADDLMPLTLREVVLHGQNVMAGLGEDTPGEINGDQDGYVGILPVAAGEIETTDLASALSLLSMQRDAASDRYRLGAGDDEFSAGAGDDTVHGGRGNDTIMGGGDDDLLAGKSGRDHLSGDGGDDRLLGQNGRDYLSGGDGNDMLRGGHGADRLRGGDGDDRLVGNNGNDMMRGGKGADVFVFNDAREGHDVIADFDASEDSLVFGDAVPESYLLEQQGSDTTIQYGESMLTLQNFDVQDFLMA